MGSRLAPYAVMPALASATIVSLVFPDTLTTVDIREEDREIQEVCDTWAKLARIDRMSQDSAASDGATDFEASVSPPEAKGQFGATALIVSQDRSIGLRLQGLLETGHGCLADLVDTFADAEQLIRRGHYATLFLDLRSNSMDESPVPLLKHLTDRRPSIPVVVLGEKGYAREWALLADSTVHAYIQPPISAEPLAQLSIRPPSHDGSLSARTVETESVTFRTYTRSMFAMVDQLVRMASHDVALLLIGETGTGKTTIARMIHELSTRKDKTFMTVACGALPPDLIESELFGHVKGAFTSADRNKIGKFEAADEGTLLLDEIDAVSPEQQAKLLRVIETGEFEPVGSNDTRTSHTRLVVASNVDLKQLMDQNEFRPDLYYRLNVLEFLIPPLRERPLDIVPLTLSFIQEFCVQHGVAIRRVHPDFLRVLKEYDWPGNIRELKNHVRRAVLFCQTGELTPQDLATTTMASANAAGTGSTLSEKVAKSEREILEEALRAHGSNRTATAKSLGISRVGLYKKMKKYGMIKPRTR